MENNMKTKKQLEKYISFRCVKWTTEQLFKPVCVYMIQSMQFSFFPMAIKLPAVVLWESVATRSIQIEFQAWGDQFSGD